MSQYELNNYLSFNTQYRNKYEKACPLFYADLAIADSEFRILAARGQGFAEGACFALSDVNKRFLFKTLTEKRRVVLRQRSRICVVSGELLPVGLYVLLLPHGDKVSVAGAASYLARTQDIVLSAAVRKLAETCLTEAGFMEAEDETAMLDGILCPESGITMSEFCTRIAYYAGCRIRLDSAMRELRIPHLRCDRVRLTAYLLCVALILRKCDPDGASLSIEGEGADCRLTAVCSPLPSEVDCPELFLALRYPPFSCFRLDWKEG